MPVQQQQDPAKNRTAQIHNVQRHISRAVSEMEQNDIEQSFGTRRPSQQQFVSQCSKRSSNVVRNKSMKCTRPDVTTRRAVRASQMSIASSRTSVTRPASTRTNHLLQRKIHGGNVSEAESQRKRIQTYAIKKPLPYKAGNVTVRCLSPSARQRSAVKDLPEHSLMTYMSHSQSQLSCNYVENDNGVTQPSQPKLRPCKVLRGTVSKAGSNAQSAALPRTPTPMPSVRQLNDIRAGIGFRVEHKQQQTPRADDDVILQQSPQPHVNFQPHSCCNDSKKVDMETDGRTAQVAADETVRSHLSPSEQSFSGKCDSHYYMTEQQQLQVFNYPARTTADYQPRYVQIARKTADSNDGRHRQHPLEENQQQAPGPKPSASQESVSSCQPAHYIKASLSRPPSTLSMYTVGTDVRLVMRPVPVAPSGPAGHRRLSKIPRPKLASVRPCMSATSTMSKSSSFTNLRSEFNYARPMPIERMPFSKFGLEYIVPLARQEVSITAMEAFSITGISGQRRRFLPLTESIAEDLWEKVRNRVNPLLAETAQYDAGQNKCSVSVISSTVARPVSHVATQTRKFVSLKQRKKTRLPRKEKAEKQDESNDDYSGMLVRLVQLLYLQTKLNASKADKTKTANIEETGSKHTSLNSTVADYVQKYQQQQRQPGTPNVAYLRPTQIGLHTRPHWSDHGARVYRAGSSVTHVYSKNYSSAPVGSVENESINNSGNAINSRTEYFNQAQSDMTPWRSYQIPTATAFTPSYNYDNRISKISSYLGSSNMRYIR